MTGKPESVTLPELATRPGREPRVPILLLVGNGARGGEPPATRLLRLGEQLEIGRHAEPSASGDGTALGLPDRLISRLHLRIIRQPAGYYAEDAGSTNGTLVDGRKINKRTFLSSGAVLFFGHHAAVFRLARASEVEAIEQELANPFVKVATASPTLAVISQKLQRLSQSKNDVFLLGETGTGKEVYARAIHDRAGRRGPFLAINCAALPRELAESELFGHVKGAHSMAHQRKLGLVEAADGGTLFLDEIGDMASEIQAKLLRFLQDRQVLPLGSTVAHPVDVKIIAATSRHDPKGQAGGLRPDLVARLGAQPLRLPPLCQRVEDLGALTHHFLKPLGSRPLAPPAFQALCLYPWPRNIRELEKVIAEAAALGDPGADLTLDHLPPAVQAALRPRNTTAPTEKRATPTKEQLEELLRQHEGNVASIARALNRQWAVVWRWIGRYEIDLEPFRRS